MKEELDVFTWRRTPHGSLFFGTPIHNGLYANVWESQAGWHGRVVPQDWLKYQLVNGIFSTSKEAQSAALELLYQIAYPKEVRRTVLNRVVLVLST